MTPLLELPGFDERVRRHRWRGSRAVARFVGRRSCTRCAVGEVVRIVSGVQEALFYHGGYGAAERRTVDVCLACGRVAVAALETLNPRGLS